MAKITSKLQVTVPKAIADQYGIKPGDEVEFEPAGELIRLVPHRRKRLAPLDTARRLRLFDEATARQREREASRPPRSRKQGQRGWTRGELYDRGSAR